VDPRYRVKSRKRLFALDDTDIDTILKKATISVSTRKLVKQMWREGRPPSPLSSDLDLKSRAGSGIRTWLWPFAG